MADIEFENSLVRLLPKMRALARGLTRDATAAEDLTQETAVKALQYREDFEPGTNLSAWIHRIMVNQFISNIRKRREYNKLDQVPERGVPGNQQDRVELKAVATAYALLSPEQRTALRLIALEEQSYEEAAQKTGCAIGTLKSRVHRARSMLRDHVNGNTSSLAA